MTLDPSPAAAAVAVAVAVLVPPVLLVVLLLLMIVPGERYSRICSPRSEALGGAGGFGRREKRDGDSDSDSVIEC